MEGGTTIVTGTIYHPGIRQTKLPDLPPRKIKDTFPDSLPMSSKDVYKELRLRGYNYWYSYYLLNV